MHTHRWAVVDTKPAEPLATDSTNMVKKYPLTAVCIDPSCSEKRILVSAFDICHPPPTRHVPRSWAVMTIKATDAELALYKDMPTVSSLN